MALTKLLVGDFGNLEFLIFNDLFFCENFKFTIVAYGETKNLNYLEKKWS